MKRTLISVVFFALSASAIAGVDKDISWPMTQYLDSSLSRVVTVVPNMPSVIDPTVKVTQIWLQAGGRSGQVHGGSVAVCEGMDNSVLDSRCYRVK